MSSCFIYLVFPRNISLIMSHLFLFHSLIFFSYDALLHVPFLAESSKKKKEKHSDSSPNAFLIHFFNDFQIGKIIQVFKSICHDDLYAM